MHLLLCSLYTFEFVCTGNMVTATSHYQQAAWSKKWRRHASWTKLSASHVLAVMSDALSVMNLSCDCHDGGNCGHCMAVWWRRESISLVRSYHTHPQRESPACTVIGKGQQQGDSAAVACILSVCGKTVCSVELTLVGVLTCPSDASKCQEQESQPLSYITLVLWCFPVKSPSGVFANLAYCNHTIITLLSHSNVPQK